MAIAKSLSKVAAVIGIGESDYVGDHARVRAGERVGLPFRVNGCDGLAADQREKRGFLGRDHPDFVGEFFAVTYRVVGFVSTQ